MMGWRVVALVMLGLLAIVCSSGCNREAGDGLRILAEAPTQEEVGLLPEPSLRHPSGSSVVLLESK